MAVGASHAPVRGTSALSRHGLCPGASQTAHSRRGASAYAMRHRRSPSSPGVQGGGIDGRRVILTASSVANVKGAIDRASGSTPAATALKRKGPQTTAARSSAVGPPAGMLSRERSRSSLMRSRTRRPVSPEGPSRRTWSSPGGSAILKRSRGVSSLCQRSRSIWATDAAVLFASRDALQAASAAKPLNPAAMAAIEVSATVMVRHLAASQRCGRSGQVSPVLESGPVRRSEMAAAASLLNELRPCQSRDSGLDGRSGSIVRLRHAII